MRESKSLKIICYILIPILVLILGISLFYEAVKEQYLNTTYDDKMYFQSDDFVYSYMQTLSVETKDLIYNNSKYKNLADGEFIIFYNETPKRSELNVENFYYLIIYRNKAFTNVELTANTNTIESIKKYISEENVSKGKYANIINGEVDTNSQIISNKAIKYYNLFENTYYTTEKYSEEDSVYAITEFSEGSTIYNIYTEKIKDIEIYSSYNEKVFETEYSLLYKDIVNYLYRYEKIFIVAIPVTSIMLVLICIYLIISIGHIKGKEKIELNDFDKIPIEIITGFVVIIVGASTIIASYLLDKVNPENIVGFISLFLALYFIGYILCASWGITLVKRIKGKTLFKSSILVSVLKLIFKIIKNIFNSIKKFIFKCYLKIKNSVPLFIKIVISLFLLILISFLLIFALGPIGIIVDCIVATVMIYPMIVEINCFKKIEEKLKDIHDGKYGEKLENEDFTSTYQNTISYVNDISSGFEKAIEESVKSERLKTELITNVSHDIKTPLTSIINYVDLLKKENIEDEKVKEYLDVLENKSQRLKKLTEDLVEASKASSGNVKLNLEKINICELIKQATGEFEDKFAEKKLEIIMNFPENDMYINADNRYMYRVIENLFSNISKYALEKSRVYIDIKKNENKVNVIIKNISKEKLNISSEELMQRFVRGDKSRTTEGSGLGISISKSLTELQKGIFSLQIDGDLFKVELEFDIEE